LEQAELLSDKWADIETVNESTNQYLTGSSDNLAVAEKKGEYKAEKKKK